MPPGAQLSVLVVTFDHGEEIEACIDGALAQRGDGLDVEVVVADNASEDRSAELAREAGALAVATGRSDFPNQINNVLAFPGVFRGLLDAQSHAVPQAALLAAARALAAVVTDDERHANYIIPSVFHPDLSTTVAAAVSSTIPREPND